MNNKRRPKLSVVKSPCAHNVTPLPLKPRPAKERIVIHVSPSCRAPISPSRADQNHQHTDEQPELPWLFPFIWGFVVASALDVIFTNSI
ncbi:MAG: hypothetical protein CMN85_11010 [Spongiibacteraceae bacterium]|uniref:hypothetical protein n=1 Tax=uncultured Haliea sp. TaxID=622616 RepID=UPI000C4D9D21|nr:hypothetical protein [Spongiibacteraceae bacterium]|tara:strand:- start:4891 stop:5157 length:267 start_codon:yes stop_codon:yes gene_type:complete